MSTSALASARRRRTTNEPQVVSQVISNKIAQQESPNSSKQILPPTPPQSLTPLQILQIHDNKLKELETLIIELNSEEYISNVVDEKIGDLIQTRLATFSNELDKVKTSATTANASTSFEAKLQLLATSNKNNLILQNVRFEEFKTGIVENYNTFKENINKMVDLLNTKENNNLNTSILTSTTSDSNSSLEKLDLLNKEVNELKFLVIKNQTLALETCTSIINMKDEFKLNNEKIEHIMDKINDINNTRCGDAQCGDAQCDPTQMFLQSFMKNKLFGEANNINMGVNYEDEDDFDTMVVL